ncbi:L-lactate dehydrogenase [Noviherbaspirillum sp. UKPF54]|uniref:L-lactate dehydrogenase n=1 Tax=Noviherbaspirillum sp. UKPF54 TaxID=2601898 RepID=UPI0011B19299|nr:L-lactate dehydrogenase [Noviherbaspirillum sp. UKPF54]QDZ27939.1 L-lactate dehydrogenase [Noviherbaspirillum sp. UKPF54]
MPRDQSLFLQPACAGDYRELARRRLPRQFFDYLDGGAYDESTMRANVDDLRSVLLRQRVMRDVSRIDLRTEVLGQKLAMPVVLAPVGLAGMFARRGEVQAALAAQGAGIPFCESTVSICPMEELRAAGAAFWYQLYVMRDRGYVRELLQRAHAAGSPVLLLTVDLAVVGARYRDVRNGVTGARGLKAGLARAWDFASHPSWLIDVALGGKPLVFGNLRQVLPHAQRLTDFRAWIDSQFDPSVTWDDLAWLRDNWPGKIVAKGILDADDARRAADLGLDGLIVSNHGGRQLDGVPSAISALPAVADAVGDRIDVLVDGGIRSGLDVVKALALGARACLLGRAWAYALAARGGDGVSHVLDIVSKEMEVAMALTACPDVRSITREALASQAMTGPAQYAGSDGKHGERRAQCGSITAMSS